MDLDQQQNALTKIQTTKLGGHSIYLFQDGFISLDYLWFVHHIIPMKILAIVHVHTYVPYSNLTIPARNIIINLGQSGMLCALFWHALKLGSSNSVKCVPNWNPKQTYQKATFLHSLILQLVWFCFLTLSPQKTTPIPKLTFWQFLFLKNTVRILYRSIFIHTHISGIAISKKKSMTSPSLGTLSCQLTFIRSAPVPNSPRRWHRRKRGPDGSHNLSDVFKTQRMVESRFWTANLGAFGTMFIHAFVFQTIFCG